MPSSKNEHVANARCAIEIGACRGVVAKHVIMLDASKNDLSLWLWQSGGLWRFVPSLLPHSTIFKNRLGETWRNGEKY